MQSKIQNRPGALGLLALFSILNFQPSIVRAQGTVITNNLPPNTAIVNLDARTDGASGYNGDQSFWYSPFSVSGPPLTYAVSAGVYSFRVINPADAAALFPALTAAQTNQIFTAWTFNSPWTEDYLVFGSAATNDSSIPQLFDGAYTNVFGGGPFYSDAAGAYNAVIQNGSFDEIRVGGRDSTVFTNRYTFVTATNLIFAVPDYVMSDNAGGVSVVVTKIGDLASGAPALNISQSGNTVTVSWPDPATNTYTLQQTANLAAGNGGWATSGYSITTADGTNSITIASASGSLFFRLKQ